MDTPDLTEKDGEKEDCHCEGGVCVCTNPAGLPQEEHSADCVCDDCEKTRTTTE